VTPSRKLFIAAILVAAGYGTAALLGAPDPRQWPDSWAQVVPSPSRASQSAEASTNASRAGGVRLLPESSAVSTDRIATTDAIAVAAPKAMAPFAMTAASPSLETRAASSAVPNPPLLTGRPLPRAALKNEAPRPLPDADRPAAQIPERQIDATAYDQPVSSQNANAETHVMSAGYAPTSLPATGTIRAQSDFSPPPIPDLRLVAPNNLPPWPNSFDEEETVRTHIIVDGDSLAKLAGRYLDDPRRSEEIFTLNRGVLSDPELLPIGLELKMPPRGVSRNSANSWPQSQVTGMSTVHAADRTGFTPPRALPPTNSGPPRAQLLPPKPVD
jgi:nucleoid-associated protein YgaU